MWLNQENVKKAPKNKSVNKEKQKEGGRKTMDLWGAHQKIDSHFWADHFDVVLHDAFHRIKAFLLYPLNCACRQDCTCASLRADIILSLNVNLYNTALKKQEGIDRIYGMRYFLKIPDDSFFREHYGTGYPLWLIDQEFHEKFVENHFEAVGRLVWTLMRLAKTYELSFYQKPQASLTEAIEIILGSTPLKRKKREKAIYICGEKGYGAYMNTYKSVCHFIAAFQYLAPDNTGFKFSAPEQIEAFLSLSHWIRQKLLSIQTPNVKGKCLFTKEALVPLPPWVTSDNLRPPIKPFAHRLKELKIYWERRISQ